MLLYLGIATAIGVLWSEPKWAIYLLSAVLIVGFAVWLGSAELSSGRRALIDVEMGLFAPAAIFAVAGLGIVLFRGPHLRAKHRQLDAEIDEIVNKRP